MTALVLSAAAVRACNVPVFRYALERFQSDPFDFVIYHRGPLGTEAKAAVDAMQKLASDSSAALQLQVRLVDLAAPAKPAAPPDPKAAPASKPPADAPPPSPQPPAGAVLPWLMVVPPGDEQASPLWSGPFRAADLQALLDSPARRTLAERLLKGDSAVFVLLESGRRAADEAAEQLLRKTLAGMEKSLQLPPQDDDAGNPDNQIRSKVPLRIAFSVLKVSRADPAEKRLVEMLDHFLEKPGTAQGPIVFPVFGRGRVLAVLPGESLTADALQEAGDFLCGNCTCMMKGQLPGADLLLAADWESLWEGRAVRSEPPGLAGLGVLAKLAQQKAACGFASGARAAEEPEPLATAAEPASPGSPLRQALLATLAGAVVLVLLGTLLVRTRRRQEA
jgi:hypothetical protein